MKKTATFLLVAVLGFSARTGAVPVTADGAKAIAISWYQNVSSIPADGIIIRDVQPLSYQETVTSYVFRFENGGFVIVAADDASMPVLGYSTENPFPVDISCPAVRNWMDNYGKQILEIRKTGAGNRETRKQWDEILEGRIAGSTLSIGPLITTTWGQACYYNQFCPVDPNGYCNHALTGCGPTAMGQIMKYHNFPPQGVGSHSYYHPDYGTLSADFGETSYDWASMPVHLSSYNIPTATLLFHAGVAVNAHYTAGNTNSWYDEICDAFVEYFNYDPEVQCHVRQDYPDQQEWMDLLINDLENNLPVFYWGYGPDNGHYFICDGYNAAQDKFHFNWGWNGNYNGWFEINSLTPNGIDFNSYNAIFTNLKPYNPDLIVRIVEPQNNYLVRVGQPVEIRALVITGNIDIVKITIDGEILASGTSGSLNYSWNTSEEDVGSRDVRAWLFSGGDSVYHRINLNVSADWIAQSTSFGEPWMAVSGISAVDTNIVWAIARHGVDAWYTPAQAFTRTLDGGKTWEAGNIPGCEGLAIGNVAAINESKAFVTMYWISGTNPQGIYGTDDGGVTWNNVEGLFNTPYSFANCVHFFDDSHGWCMGDPVYQAGIREFEIYTTNDGGNTWIAVPVDNIPEPLSGEYGLMTHCAVNDTIWFGTNMARIYKSTDRGNTWTATEVPAMDGKWITPVFRNGSHGLVHDFFHYLGEEKLCETFDGGETWTEIEHSGPIFRTDLAYVPGTGNTWVNTGGIRSMIGKGASVSYDGGHTWEMMPGTEGIKFRQMDWVSPCCGWAGGFSDNDSTGGIFKFIGDISNLITSVDPISFSDNRMKIFPNPSRDDITVMFSLPDDEVVSLAIYDLSGRKIRTEFSAMLPEGEHNVLINSSGLESGTYIIALFAGDLPVIRKWVVEK